MDHVYEFEDSLEKMTLNTQRLTLRPIEVADLEAVHEYAGDK